MVNKTKTKRVMVRAVQVGGTWRPDPAAKLPPTWYQAEYDYKARRVTVTVPDEAAKPRGR